MSSAAPVQREETNSLTPRPGLLTWLKPFVTSSVGMKATTAVTGFLLTGFVVVHLIGTLKVFDGPHAVNSYAKFLKDLGPLLWLFRGALLTVFLLHVVLALTLARRARLARPVRYQHPATIQAT